MTHGSKTNRRRHKYNWIKSKPLPKDTRWREQTLDLGDAYVNAHTIDFRRSEDGIASWINHSALKYVVTGTDVYGKRFSLPCTSWSHARGINGFQGSKWIEYPDGSRTLISRHYN